MLKSKISHYYEAHDCQRISQGDILRDFSFVISAKGGVQLEIEFQYLVVLTQDCDLEQGNKIYVAKDDPVSGLKLFNQYLHNILLLPAFPAELMKSGEHLKDVYYIKTEPLSRKIWERLTKNATSRYHYLPAYQSHQIPELLIDFKAYYTVYSQLII